MGNGPASDKARKARSRANETIMGVSARKSENIAKANAKVAGKKLSNSELEKATNIIQGRRNNDASRTARRATFIASPASPASKRATSSNVSAAVTGLSRKAPSKKGK